MEEDRPVSNLPYDESVDVSDAEDVPTALSITPRAQPMQPNLSHCSDEEEEEDEEEDDDIQTGLLFFVLLRANTCDYILMYIILPKV